MNPLKGKKVVVIGSRSGMGFAIAKVAAAEAAQVVISGRSAKRLEAALANIEQDVLIYPWI
ncbi:MAG: SDR family NAD(P)-dependent oxidoreductase [Cyanobacteria bacterium P01_H01_bin.21]